MTQQILVNVIRNVILVGEVIEARLFLLETVKSTIPMSILFIVALVLLLCLPLHEVLQ